MLSTLVALLALFSAFLFWWVRRTFTFWNGRGVAHLSFWQYLRFVYDIYTKPVNEVIRRSYNRYGRVYGSYQGTVPTLVVGDPDILREVLTTKFQNFADRTLAQTVGSDVWKKSIFNLSGEEWKKARAIFTPALTAARLKTILNKVRTISGRMTSRVMDAATENKPVNFYEGPLKQTQTLCKRAGAHHEILLRLASNTALEITAALNYSVDVDSNDKNHPLMKCIEAIYMGSSGWRIIMLFLMPTVYKVLQPDYPPKSSTDVFKAFVSHLIEERKSKNKEEDDFLQVFMNADYNWEDNAANKAENADTRKMSLEEITAQGIGFFVAGVESVTMALSVTTYYLALNPDCQDRVIAEIDKVLTKGELTYDALQEMPYLDACFKEPMRLCTPDSINMRLCTEETTVAGIQFEPGMCVDIPMAGIHHDPEYFPEPEKFNPERCR